MNNDEWVDLLYEARVGGKPAPVCSSRVSGLDHAVAYTAQAGLVERLEASITGFKGALTNKAAQAAMGIDVPVSGVLLEDMRLTAGSIVELGNYSHAVVETEIGFCIGKPVSEQISTDGLMEYVEYCLPMIEIADIGCDDPAAMTIYDFIAANSAAAGYIVGQGSELEAVNEVTVSLFRDGELLHEGRAKEALGDQFAAATWLINQVVGQGYTIEPGFFLMTGSLGALQMATKPGLYSADYGAFGKIEFEFI
jgi:2-keto-4-pentenoate hydratase|tara:strand:- start:275 stop:1030 length:756 start_codon:yes stop_codon:yes gene_type:complete